MPYMLLLHLNNEDPILGEVDDLPHPTDSFVLVSNVRRRDGKDLHSIEPDTVSVIFPWHRIVFIEVMSSEEEGEVIGFVRE
jgi:hypothetical protein